MNLKNRKLSTITKVYLVVFLCLLILGISLVYAAVSHFSRGPDAPIVPAKDVLVWKDYNPGEIPTGRLGITENPLFWEERQPYVPPAVEKVNVELPQVNATPLKGVKLLGLYLAGDESYALLQNKDEKVQVQQGQVFEGWTLTRVTLTEAVFSSSAADGGESLAVLKLTDREPLTEIWNRHDAPLLNQ